MQYFQNFVFTLSTNNIGVVRARPSRNINQGRMYQHRRRNTSRIRRCIQPNAPIDNRDTLNRITDLPQQTVNDPLINEFFNGSPFI